MSSENIKTTGTIVKVLPFDPDVSEREIFFCIDETEDDTTLRKLNSVLFIGYSGKVVSWDKICPNSYEESLVIYVEFTDGSVYGYLPDELEIDIENTPSPHTQKLYYIAEGVYENLSQEELADARAFLQIMLQSGTEADTERLVDTAIELSVRFSTEAKKAWYRDSKRIVKYK